MKFSYKPYLFLLFFGYTLNASANVTVIKKENIKNEKITSAKIIYHGAITPEETMELISVIDEINNNYPKTKDIKLYINSFGGSMESAYMAYEAIKHSAIPVITINTAIVGSAASIIYCAGQSRLSFPLANFMLHPAATPNFKNKYIRPNEIDLLRKDAEIGNNFFRGVYQQCSNLKNEELQKILFSEDFRKYIPTNKAQELKVATGVADGITLSDISYYITNKIKD
ncbi:ATP-dependent Clp protease proteolytic subunit [Candidatus Arsenophonus triatominarum]|nr:ATP-dependent Clp protease proteolytic subunit [Candidatus Arsenophonus triatominarum]